MTGRAAFLASLPRKRIAAGALIRDRQGAVCLVEPTYKELWHLPGGTVEADEAPSDGCRRELLEELGVELPLGPLLVLHWVRPEPPVDPHGALQLVYDGGVVEDSVVERFVVPPDELRGVHFVRPDELAGVVSDDNRRRIEIGLRSLRTGSVTELV